MKVITPGSGRPPHGQQVPRRARGREVRPLAERVPRAAQIFEEPVAGARAAGEAHHHRPPRGGARARSSSASSSAPAPRDPEPPCATAPRAPRRPFAGRRVLLGVTGGIAAYKAVQLARDLSRRRAPRWTSCSSAGARGVRAAALLRGAHRAAGVHSAMHAAGEPLLHIRLAREADAGAGRAGHRQLPRPRRRRAWPTTCSPPCCSPPRAPVVLCPAMNDRMYAHPQTAREPASACARDRLPHRGPRAWGRSPGARGRGPGACWSPAEILEHAGRALEGGTPLSRAAAWWSPPAPPASRSTPCASSATAPRAGWATRSPPPPGAAARG